jgi:hypothetical protein
MEMKLPLVLISKPSSYRQCSICEDGTIADHELTFKTGYNSHASIAYCTKHLIQLSTEVHGITLEAFLENGSHDDNI